LVLAGKVSAAELSEGELWGGTTIQQAVEDNSGLTTTDPREIIANVIRIIMGFLGIIAVVIILMGGFKWMTAAGGEEKISEAKKMITAGVIGLVIVLASFGIATFVISSLQTAVGDGA
jgi:hypothetical protein